MRVQIMVEASGLVEIEVAEAVLDEVMKEDWQDDDEEDEP